MSIDPDASGPPDHAVPGRDRFEGCLLGLAIGDGLGAPYEGLPEDVIFAMGPADRIVADFPEAVIRYTDDTQMTIAVAEALAERGEIEEEALCAAFVSRYEPDRGYGPGARRILGAMRDGHDWRSVARDVFPGGSLGNGAAMRVAPIGLLFGDDLERVAEQAERSARPTHLHPIGIDGARLMAVAVALAMRGGPFDRKAFFRDLAPFAQTEDFRWQLATARRLPRTAPLGGFGNGLEAHRSVTTALAIFAAAPDDYPAVVARAIGQGNDVDTLAAMAGALSGARLGRAGIPQALVDKLEDGAEGRSLILDLAGRLHEIRVGRPDPR